MTLRNQLCRNKNNTDEPKLLSEYLCMNLMDLCIKLDKIELEIKGMFQMIENMPFII